MIPTRFVLCGLAATLVVVSGSGWAASWQWRDAQGRMVYSDRAPPSEVPAARIVRAPAPVDGSSAPAGATDGPASSIASGASPAGSESTAAVAGSPSAFSSNAPAAGASWVERERAFRERKAEREANEAKAREEGERAAHTKRACDGTRETIRVLESGMRVASMNPHGESEPVDDAERARRLKAARADLARYCAGS